MREFLADLRHAARSLRKAPTLLVVAVTTLAVGVGVTTTAFNLADWLLLRPVRGIDAPDRLAVIWSASRNQAQLGAQFISYDAFQVLADGVGPAATLAGYQRGGSASIGAQGEEPRHVNVQYVMPNYFSVLGVRPFLGRPFLSEDDAPPEGQAVAVISDQLWAGLFNRDPAALGKNVIVNGRAFAVVGVTPRGFRGTERLAEVDLWLPGRVSEQARGAGYYEFIARLAPGASYPQIASRIRGAFTRLSAESEARVFEGVGVQPLQRAQVTEFVRLTLAASCLVLLIACANVTDLLLFRGLSRRPVTAMQKALGASTSALVRRQVAESLVLSLPALLIGLALAALFTGAFKGASLGRGMEPLAVPPVAWSAVLFGALLSVGTAVVAATGPVLAATHTEPLEATQGAMRGHTRRITHVRRALTVVQLSLALSLLVGALLLVRTLQRLNAVNLGFEPRGVMVLNVNPGEIGYSGAQARTYYRELHTRLRGADIGEVAMAWQAPFVGMVRLGGVVPPGAPGDSGQVRVRDNAVSPEYFNLLGLAFVEGRSFTSGEFLPDSGAPRRVILSESLARHLFGYRPATGQLIYRSKGGRPHEVVGVVRDSRWESLIPQPGPLGNPSWMVYVPFGQGWIAGAVVLVRSRLPERAAAEAVARIAGSLDKSLAVYGATNLPSLIEQSVSDRILFARLLAALASVAILLATVGLYGLIAYGVAAHRREFGIRIALGSAPSTIALLVLRESAVLGAIGVAVGLIGAVVLGRLLAIHLYGVSTLDPVTYIAAASALMAVATVAALGPARAATRADPLASLRAE